MAKVIEQMNRPALVLAHNKTLAAQLFNEFRNFFPQNAVEYFVSYYDYYQPEAYLPASDTYIEKESTINDELDRLRMSATRSLFERRDVIIVASVSCIYGLGSPEAYYGMLVMLEPGQTHRARGPAAPARGHSVRARRGFAPRHLPRARRHDRNSSALRGPRLPHRNVGRPDRRRLRAIDSLTGEVRGEPLTRLPIYPKIALRAAAEQKERAIRTILEELAWWKPELEKQGKYVEAQRVWQRTMFDVEMMRTIGYCHGIENYSRHCPAACPAKRRPRCSITCRRIICSSSTNRTRPIPQLHGHVSRRPLAQADAGGLRLPHALGARQSPADFRGVRASHQSGDLRFGHARAVRTDALGRRGGRAGDSPDGLVDPEVEVRPVKGQVDDLLEEIRLRAEKNERVLVTTLTKRMSEDLAEYFAEVGVRCRYLHSEIETLERVRILRDLRRGEFDALIGINLLREGLDLPEVSLVAILDADKEGYLRSATALIQTIGRCARHINGRAILYADVDDRFDAAGHRRDQSPPRQAARLQRRATASRRRASSRAWI